MNMLPENSQTYVISTEVNQARKLGLPLVALESAVITHGLPYPENVALASEVEREVRANDALPATIALLAGRIHIGLSQADIERLATETKRRKVSKRDIALTLARRENGGTTVAATLFLANRAEIKVFATGGIGGVHRNAPFDVSADLPELGRTPMVVVCAGAKAILDLPATLEYLETMSVPVVGYQTDEFPAFYSRSSGLRLSASVNSPGEVVNLVRLQQEMGLTSAILVCVPPPAEDALPRQEIEEVIQQATEDADQQGIHGAALTPFLLTRVSQLTHGASLRANLSLLRNNARVAAQIAYQMANLPRARQV
jgi:pseudouridine-5'-phosphate glycosidase